MSGGNGAIVLVVLALLAGLGVIAAFRSGARSAYRVARQTQQVTRMGGNLARALGTSVVIVGVQWAVVSFTTDPRAWGVAFGVPALLAGSVHSASSARFRDYRRCCGGAGRRLVSWMDR